MSQGSGEGFTTDTPHSGASPNTSGAPRTASGNANGQRSNSFGAASSGGDGMQSGGTASPVGTAGNQGTSSGGEAEGGGDVPRARSSGKANRELLSSFVCQSLCTLKGQDLSIRRRQYEDVRYFMPMEAGEGHAAVGCS